MCRGCVVIANVCALADSWLENDPLGASLRGRTIQEDPTTEVTITRALRWIEECNSKHSDRKCSVQDVELPSRVLDLAYERATSHIRLYETQGMKGKYCALSHVWGSDRNLTTIRSNIGALKEGISEQDLPKTFQDAILVTRKPRMTPYSQTRPGRRRLMIDCGHARQGLLAI